MSVRRHFSLQLILISMTLLCQLNAQVNLRIAVLDFQNLTGREEMKFLEKAIPQILITDLMLCDKITIVERSRMQDILDEMQLTLSGVIDEEMAVEIGTMAGANAILVGSITVGGEVYRIDSRLVDVATAEVLLTEKKDWLSEDEIIRAVDELAEAIIRQLTGEFIDMSPDFNYEPLTYYEDQVLTMETALDKPVWLNGSGEPVYLQVDIYSKEISRRERIPLNIALVIDRSGSMASERKLDYVKQAAEFVVRNLDREDILSLVTYESQVQVVVPAQVVQNKRNVLSIIKGINTGGSTNLSGGMLEGYSQIAKHLKTGQVNRGLLLSDGLANQGITRSEKLQAICQDKISKGMSISTFGVGADFDEDLMLSLAEHGNGNYYFIGSPDQIPTIFSREMTGLLAVAAQNVRIEIETAPRVKVEKVFGYLQDTRQNQTEVSLGDVFSNDHYTVTFKLSLPANIGDSLQLAKVSLSYDDVTNNGDRIKTGAPVYIYGTTTPDERDNYLNPNVSAQVTLLYSAQQIQSAIQKIEDGNIDDTRKELGKQLALVSSSAQKYKNPALKKQILTIHKYTQILDDADRKSGGQQWTKKTLNDFDDNIREEIRATQKAAKYDLYQFGKGKEDFKLYEKPATPDTTSSGEEVITKPAPSPAPSPLPDLPITPKPTPSQDPRKEVIREGKKPTLKPDVINSPENKIIDTQKIKTSSSPQSKPVVSPQKKTPPPKQIPESTETKQVKSSGTKKTSTQEPDIKDKPVSQTSEDQTTNKKQSVKNKD
ncbi:MAG: VWA domain-containing protein [Candidatus Marinimicrobia bacterium]|nr:VWA domain-containing protein [Candidatus Neomarinimicrobiota bacterium]